MKSRLTQFDLFTRVVPQRKPFSFGKTTINSLTHLIFIGDFVIDGQEIQGYAAENLTPQWFQKNPVLSVSEETSQLRAIIQEAGQRAISLGEHKSPFTLWYALYKDMHHYATSHEIPPLVSSLGISIVERALLHACCRRYGITLHQAMRQHAFGADWDILDADVSSVALPDILPEQPLSRIAIRHTVGLSDELENSPDSLEDYIIRDKIRYFKIKIGGDPERDASRLGSILNILERSSQKDFQITIDGNESYADPTLLIDFWKRINTPKEQRELLQKSLLFIEQPFPRTLSLSDDIQRFLSQWTDSPPLIIDESDADLGAFRRAATCGYKGTSHKNCKGVFKSFLNLMRIAVWQERDGTPYLLSAEDLTNIAPVALLEDLCVVSSLGLTHAERNGHHYIGALDHLEPETRHTLIETYPDLFHQDQNSGNTSLTITNGEISTQSINNQAFGVGFDLKLNGWNLCSRQE